MTGDESWQALNSQVDTVQDWQQNLLYASIFRKDAGKDEMAHATWRQARLHPEEGRLRLAVVFIIWRPTILKMSVPNRSTNDIGALLTRTINICRGRIREIKCANQARAVFTDFRDGINHSQGTCLYAAHNMVAMRAGNSAI